jgi:hypothetical protein
MTGQKHLQIHLSVVKQLQDKMSVIIAFWTALNDIAFLINLAQLKLNLCISTFLYLKFLLFQMIPLMVFFLYIYLNNFRT